MSSWSFGTAKDLAPKLARGETACVPKAKVLI
jgi:hypothetical protein